MDRAEVGRVGHNGHIRAVDERLLGSTSHRLLAVGAGAPRVAGVVRPLHDALGAGQVGRQLDLPVERRRLVAVLRDDEADRLGAGET